MQREILFRGQRVDTKEWVYGDLIHLEKDFKRIVKILHWTGDDNSSEVIPETVGQFTGLVDNNGNKIFEGDKLNIFWGIGLGDTMEIVKYDVRYGYFKYGNAPICELIEDSKISYLVIGNIHEP